MKSKVVGLCILCFVSFFVGLTAIGDIEADTLGLFLILGLLLIAPLFLAGIARWFNPLESAYLWLPVYGYVYLVKPMVRVILGEPFWFGEQNLNWALSVATIGLIAFYIGYYCRLGAAISKHVPIMSGGISQPRFRFCGWAFIVIGAAGFWWYMATSGGWRQFWSLPHGYGGKPELSTAYIYGLPDLMVVGFFLITYDAMICRRFTLLTAARVVAASIGGIGVNTILLGRRKFVLWVLLTIFILYFLRKGKRPGAAAILLLGLSAFLAVSLTLAYRSHIHLGASWEDLAAVDLAGAAITAISQPRDEFDSFLAIVGLYPDSLNYDYFGIYGRILIHPIPRLLWPDKPPLFVSSWDDFLFRTGIGWGSSESVLGDLYIQMGLLGVLIGMFVAGVLFKFLYAYLMRAPSTPFMQLLYAVAIGNIPIFVIQSGIAAFWNWMPLMIPGVLVAYWATRKRTPIGWRPRAVPRTQRIGG